MTNGSYVPARTGTRTIDGQTYETYTGVILKGTGNAQISYRIGESSGKTVSQTTNYLIPLTDETYVEPTSTIDGVEYTNMAIRKGVFKYYSVAGTELYNRAYLSVPSSALSAHSPGARSFGLKFCDPETTGIREAKMEHQYEDYYDLQGIRISKPMHGIYIHSRKKVYLR